ncbi:MAG: ATP-dependent helicase HrpB [Paludibacteraceae bacterium]|nr:ATP-dependent helicase HrpB [Paludibacteraceae bacterium]
MLSEWLFYNSQRLIPPSLNRDNLQIDEAKVIHLPAYSIADEVNRKLKEHNRLIITAEPGAGKSTLLPLTLLKGFPNEGKIILLEPRRIAAKQIAERMAELLHEKVGETVGYQVRFENCTSARTRIVVMTEGILPRMLVGDPFLDGVSTVLFDEFHERSLATDEALALVRETQEMVRPDLRIVIMSATIDTNAISNALDAPIVESKGRMFPVKISHSEEDANTEQVAEQVAQAILKASKQEEGDILAFLPGEAEILRCRDLLEGSLPETEILPLYGQLSPQEQRKAILPSPQGRRKVVLATSIAETSLTIEGVRIVVDSGLCRKMDYDPRTGLSHLVTTRISKDVATQRSGRAGRICEGSCHRLWTLATEHRMEEFRKPEIETADLASTLLDIVSWGGNDFNRLPWLTPPPASNVRQAAHLLQLLGATDEQGKVTEMGTRMAHLPCHPRIARMLINETNEIGKALASDIAALIEEKDPLGETVEDADINTRIVLLREARKRGNEGKWKRIIRIASEYRKLVRTKEENTPADYEKVGLLIANAYPERIAKAEDHCGHFRLASGEKAFINKEDQLSAYDWIAVAALNASSGRVFLASPLNPKSVQGLSRTKRNVSWDNKRGCLVATQEERIGNLILGSKALSDLTREEITETLCIAVAKNGLSLLDFSEEVERMQRRIECVADWHPDLELPDLGTESVLSRAKEWLPLYLENNGQLATTANETKKIDMTAVLWGMLTYEQQQTVERLTPSHITVPTGSRIRVDYRKGAEAPVVSVRLQECFGMTDTPRIDDGKRPVLMELLSPGFKPVQLTQDLRSFWENTYFEVRKELRRRYPKHYWPDNPLEAEATRGVNRKR